MKNTMFLALMVLATLPAAAQEAANSKCSVNSETTTTLGEEYAASIDGLLRDAHASLQKISEAVEAESMSTERAQKLKLAVTRDIISRLDALSAVYEARLDSKERGDRGPLENASATRKPAHAALTGTISVDELKRESGAALATTSTEEVTR
jgi:hypothetical protein